MNDYDNEVDWDYEWVIEINLLVIIIYFDWIVIIR